MTAKRYAHRISSTSSWPEYFKPSFTQKLTFKYVVEGEPVVFMCSLIACPVPEITWFHNNRPIPTGLRRVIKTESDLHHHSSSLEVKRVQDRDSGSYRLLAVNSEGSAESTASLLVIQKGQDEKYLEFLKRAEQTHENMEALVARREDRLKVDLRFTGSPFNKKQDVEQVGMMRTIHFKSASPGKKTDFLYDEEYLENQSDIGGWLNVGESFLDEETKMKLQRLREARKMLMEKKKVSLLEMPSEISARTLGSDASEQETLLTREEVESSFVSDLAESRDKDDYSTEDIIQKPHALPTQMDQTVEPGEPPTSFLTTVDEEILQTEVRVSQEALLRESLPEDQLYDEILVSENTQSGEFREIVTSTSIGESSEYIPNTCQHEEIYETPEKVSQVSIPYVSESFGTHVNIQANEDGESGRTTKDDLRESQYSAPTKVDEFKTKQEEKTTRVFESYFQRHPQRCPPSFLQEIESQEVYEGDSCQFVCHFQGYPQPIVTWYNNDIPIPRNQGFVTQTLENYSTLTFPSVHLQNRGSITCVLFNQYGTVKTTAVLTVKAKQRHYVEAYKVPVLHDYTDEEEELALVFDQAKDIYPHLGQEGQENFSLLQSNPPGLPSADAELLSFPVEIQVTAATPTPEQDKEVREMFQSEDRGPEATAPGQAVQSPKHKFKFSSDITNEPPRMLEEMPKHARCREGDSLVLECLISGEPQPVVMWFQNGVLLKPNQKFQFEEVNGSHRLFIIDVNSQDSGKYKCVAENNSGIAESVLDLSVEPVAYREYSQLQNIGGTDVHYSRDQQAQTWAASERAHFYNYPVDPFVPQLNIKEYSIKECFQSFETTKQIPRKEQVRCTLSRERLPRFMQGASRSIIVNQPLRAEFIRCQDEGREEHVSEKALHHAEGTVYPFVDDFSNVNIRREVRKDFRKLGETEWANVQEYAQSDYLPNVQSERPSDSYKTKDLPITVYEAPLGEERRYLGKKVKHRIIAFEKLQCTEKGFLEKRPTRKSFVNPPQRKSDAIDFSLTQRESRSRNLNTNMYHAEEMSPDSGLDSSHIEMNLKLLSAPIPEDLEVQESEQQKETGPTHQHAVSEKAEQEAPPSFDLKQFHSQRESADVKFQKLDSGQPEAYCRIQHAASEPTDTECLVFDLKQMYSHLEDPTKKLQGQETKQQQEIHYKEEILGPEPLASDSHGAAEVVQNNALTSKELSSSPAYSDRIQVQESSIDENTVYLEKEAQHVQEQNVEMSKTDLSLRSFSEEIHSESCAFLQTSSDDLKETEVSEKNSVLENGDGSLISHLKKAASKEQLLEACEREQEWMLGPESESFPRQESGVQADPQGTLEDHKARVLEADPLNRQLSLSQCLPFLMTGEQISGKTDSPEEERCYEAQVQEERCNEAQVQDETSFSTVSENTETCFSENLPTLDEARPADGVEFEASLTQYLLATGKHQAPATKDTKPKPQLAPRDSVTSMEVEEVTFNTVYEYYSQRQEPLGRPYSPESDISIDVGSTSSEEISELDQFYTPPSSVEHFESPMSPDLYFNPSDTTKQSSTNSGGETVERYCTPSEEVTERYSTPSEGEIGERYSTPPGETLERFSTPPGEALERYSTPPGEALERFSTPPGEALERYSTPPGETLEGDFIPTGRPNPTGKFEIYPSKIEREDSTPIEHFHTPTEERTSPYDICRSDSFGTPNEAIEPKDNEMPPSFIEPLTRRKIYENTTLGFIVEVEGLPVPGVKWYRNKSLLEPDDRVRMERVGNVCSLEISNIQKGEGGEYMCHAVNIIGEAKSFAKVDIMPREERAVALPPPVTHQHVMEFDLDNATSSRTPSPQEIVLEVELSEKDVKEFEKQVKIVTVPEFTPDHKSMIVSLDVLPLNLVDPNMAAREEENKDLKIDLEVFEMPPRFIMPICDFKIPENSDAVFKCSVIGIPTPEVQWYKEYMYIEPDNEKYVISEEKGCHTLKIRNVCLSDSATYRCRAVNCAGEAICRGFLTMGDSEILAMITKKSIVTLSSSKAELVLKSKYADCFFEFQVMEGPPRFIKGISDCYAPLGTAAYFQCLVRGSPRPTVYWYKDGKLVQGGRFSAEESGTGFHNLFITSLVKSDEGEYRCVATNKSGMAETCATLTLT